jgi:glycosyltransferase involved in cell wall biosynthesis
MTELPSITVIVCTYRRPGQLQELLDSLRVQHVQGLRPRLCIVDNDAEQSARAVVEQAQANFPWPLQYVVQPVKNIALTRNAGLATVTTDYLAFIDDDEVAVPQWLHSLVALARESKAQLVFGPVLPVYPQEIRPWLVSGGFYERPRHVTGTLLPLLEARTGNVLLDAALLQGQSLQFDETLGLSGGEDYAFFEHLYQQGAKAVWSDEAVVTEAVPADRATPNWLLKRSFRIGSVEASLMRRSVRVQSLLRMWVKVAYLMARNGVMLLAAPLRSKALNFRLVRNLAIAAGIVYGLVNGPYREYK